MVGFTVNKMGRLWFKPFKGVGSGLLEIALRHDKNAYRAALAVQLGKKNLCPACVSEKIQEGYQNAAAGH